LERAQRVGLKHVCGWPREREREREREGGRGSAKKGEKSRAKIRKSPQRIELNRVRRGKEGGELLIKKMKTT